jgi:hypothetical protein
MTDRRTPERDPRTDPDPEKERPENAERPGPEEEEPNPWTREGADAPDAADIEDPSEQR